MATRIQIEQAAYADIHRFQSGEIFDWPMARTKDGQAVDFRQILPSSLQSEDMS